MGPTFVKVGQFLSTRADLLPTAYLEALARLQDRVAPFSFAEVERIVSEDLGVRVSKAFAGFLDQHARLGKRYDFKSMMAEFRDSLLRELDYRQEARNLTILGEHLARFDRIVVPSPVADYVTSRVLAMEFIQGRKITSLGPLAKMEIDGSPLADTRGWPCCSS